MLNPGIKDLGDFNITTAGTQVGAEVTGLEGILALTASMRLAYGSGGGSVKAFLQTSLDQGATWIDIACFTYTTAGAHKVRNLWAGTPKTSDITPTDGALSDDTSVDGILGERFRVKAVSTGTYAGSTVLSCRAHAH